MKREWSSTNKRKYLEPSVDGVGDGPQISVWIISKGCKAWEVEWLKGRVWLLANWQSTQTIDLEYENDLLHLFRTLFTIEEWACPKRACQMAAGWEAILRKETIEL